MEVRKSEHRIGLIFPQLLSVKKFYVNWAHNSLIKPSLSAPIFYYNFDSFKLFASQIIEKIIFSALILLEKKLQTAFSLNTVW